MFVKRPVPKLLLLSAPQKSTVVVCASGFNRSQSGTKSPFLSVHVRVTGGGAVSWDELPTIRAVGFVAE